MLDSMNSMLLKFLICDFSYSPDFRNRERIKNLSFILFCDNDKSVMLQSELDISRNLVNLYNFGRKCHENEPQEIFS